MVTVTFTMSKGQAIRVGEETCYDQGVSLAMIPGPIENTVGGK